MSFEELERLANRVQTMGALYGIVLGLGAIGGAIYFFTSGMMVPGIIVLVSGLFTAILIGGTLRCIGITLYASIMNRKMLFEITDKLGINSNKDNSESDEE